MSDLHLVEAPAGDNPFPETPLPRRLPRGRHGIPKNLVVEHQRLRLLAAMADAVSEHGYASVTTTHVSQLANVSTSTFYKHFGNLWDCALATYVVSADQLCAAIEAACTGAEEDVEPLAVGIDAALAFLAADPARAQLLSLQPPREASAIVAARRILISRLAAMLRRGQSPDSDPRTPPSLDERLVDATLAFVGTRIAAGEADGLLELGPELTAILSRTRYSASRPR